jgi:phosphatidylinositol alpha-1,6-mannosyltransferase
VSTSKLNIIIATSEFPPQPGGIGNHAYNLALHLHNNGYHVSVIADQRSSRGLEETTFDNALPFQVERIRIRSWRAFMYIDRIVTTFKNIRDTDHMIATGKFSLWNVAFCSLFYKRNTLAVVHGTEVNFKSYLLKKSVEIALKKFKTIIAVSSYTKKLIADLRNDIAVIPNGIDLESWNNTQIETVNLQGHPILTTVGRVSSRKGQLNVIKHLPELIKIYPDVHYHCIGIPTEAEQFLEIAKTLNVENNVTFHGSLSDNDLKKRLSATNIFVMLSTESSDGDVEGFGIAILEANSMGVPAIGSKGCGIEDAINPKASGLLIDAHSTPEFMNATQTILNNMDTYKVGAQAWAKSHQWSDIIKQYISKL